MCMATTSYDFSVPADFTLTNISITSLVASLSLVTNPGQTFSQPFTSSTGFTFNASKTSITGGVLSQKSNAPANLSAYFAWDSFLNGNYGTGSLSVTAVNGAAINTGFLDLTGSSNKYVSLPAAYGFIQTGTAAFVVKPNYSGNPASNQIFFSNAALSGSDNVITLYHSQSVGHIVLVINDQNGTNLANTNLGTWTPVSGTSYNFVLQFDVTNGATKLFIGGVQFGSTIAVTGTRTAPGAVYCGFDGSAPDGNPNFSINSLALYSSVVSASGATPLADIQYVADTISLPTFNYAGLGSIVGFTGFATGGDANAPGYILNGTYWNGTAWVTSNGTYAQSNTLAVVAANISSISNNNALTIQVITQSVNSSPASITGPLVVTYSGQIYSNGSIKTNSTFTAEKLLAFVSTFNQSGADTVLFGMVVNSNTLYWNGSAWVASNGTAAQLNTLAQVQANLSTLLTVNSNVGTFVLLTSGAGTTTPNITNFSTTYNFGPIQPNKPALCDVYGFLLDLQSNPIAGAVVKFTMNPKVNPGGYIDDGMSLVGQSQASTTTDNNGYFQASVAQASQFLSPVPTVLVEIDYSNVLGSISINKNSLGKPLTIVVPVASSVNITGLLT